MESPDPERPDPRAVDAALEAIRGEFPPATWAAFREYAVAGRPAEEVAAELGLTANAVFIARCRVVLRLRRELGM